MPIIDVNTIGLTELAVGMLRVPAKDSGQNNRCERQKVSLSMLQMQNVRLLPGRRVVRAGPISPQSMCRLLSKVRMRLIAAIARIHVFLFAQKICSKVQQVSRTDKSSSGWSGNGAGRGPQSKLSHALLSLRRKYITTQSSHSSDVSGRLNHNHNHIHFWCTPAFQMRQDCFQCLYGNGDLKTCYPHSGSILCESCYQRRINWRAQPNLHLSN